jgi:hypothetical protein
MIGIDTTILGAYEYDTKLLRWFVTLDKKFQFHNITESKPTEVSRGRTKVEIS